MRKIYSESAIKMLQFIALIMILSILISGCSKEVVLEELYESVPMASPEEEEVYEPFIDSLEGIIELEDRWRSDANEEFRIGTVQLSTGEGRVFLQMANDAGEVMWRHVFPYECQVNKNGLVMPKADMLDRDSVVIASNFIMDEQEGDNPMSVVYLGIFDLGSGEKLGNAILPETQKYITLKTPVNKIYNVGVMGEGSQVFIAYEDWSFDENERLVASPVIVEIDTASILDKEDVDITKLSDYKLDYFLMEGHGLPSQMIFLENFGHMYIAYSKEKGFNELVIYDHKSGESKSKSKKMIKDLYGSEVEVIVQSIKKAANKGYIVIDLWKAINGTSMNLAMSDYNEDGIKYKTKVLIDHYWDGMGFALTSSKPNDIMAACSIGNEVLITGFYGKKQTLIRNIEVGREVSDLHILFNDDGSVDLLIEYLEGNQLKSYPLIVEKEMLEGGIEVPDGALIAD